MKKQALTLLLTFFSSLLIAQTTQTPERHWVKFDWPHVDPETGVKLNQEDTGEDWWYDHKNTYDQNGNQTGYIAVGFNYGIGRITDYDLADIDGDGYSDGFEYCNSDDSHSKYNQGPYKLELFEEPGRIRRCGRAMMMAYDLQGNEVFCRNYNLYVFKEVGHYCLE